MEKISQEQFYDMLLKREIGWKEIIYELVASQQLDPWNIDIVLLTQQYLETIRKYEEINFFISSKVLLAASILLRIKCEFLLSNIGKIDELLFGPKQQIEQVERIYIDESEIPDLLPRTPLPRQRKITLQELMNALEKAMEIESRRERRKVFLSARVFFPFLPKTDIREKIAQLYEKIRKFFLSGKENLTFSYLAGEKKENKITTFISLLYLDNQEKINMEQDRPFDEIFIFLR